MAQKGCRLSIEPANSVLLFTTGSMQQLQTRQAPRCTGLRPAVPAVRAVRLPGRLSVRPRVASIQPSAPLVDERGFRLKEVRGNRVGGLSVGTGAAWGCGHAGHYQGCRLL